ncbi:hypothetical protein NUW58_g9297 [Xylaria curta]|uniref:Uncharacterized protein n=1 Tax=Xylaria curta TaxID=42375 RepID=A0ACC1MYH3_9PEZI|nr:hypothetical protein NUW58_g9297 [Xylaria curta]
MCKSRWIQPFAETIGTVPRPRHLLQYKSLLVSFDLVVNEIEDEVSEFEVGVKIKLRTVVATRDIDYYKPRLAYVHLGHQQYTIGAPTFIHTIAFAVLIRIEKYNLNCPTQEARQIDNLDAFHTGNLEQTLQELQSIVREHENTLNKLRATPPRNYESQSYPATASLDIMKAAYDELASTTPYLPFPDSVLPALIALRRTHQTVEEMKAYLSTQGEMVDDTKKKLELAKANFSDQQVLAHSLRGRVQSLEDGLETRMEMGPEDIARERIEELKKQRERYNVETSKLLRSLRKFIDNRLAKMLAAEELGGPVVSTP